MINPINLTDQLRRTPFLESTPALEDYRVVQKTLQDISENWREQPSLDELANSVGLQPIQLQRVFSRWAGITPKQFLQAITIDHARALLQDSASILEASLEVGLSGPARLHDLFVTHEAMTPGDYKNRGAGVKISWGFHPCPFGIVLLMVTDRGLAGLAFADPGEEAKALDDMSQRWPAAVFEENHHATAPYVTRIFEPNQWKEDQPLRVVFIGTDFEIRVWQTLLKIPLGKAATYSEIAQNLGNPKASRAVGTAVGKNPLSFVVPCHRVLGAKGNMCGYHWGITRKRAILGWEAGVSGILDGLAATG